MAEELRECILPIISLFAEYERNFDRLDGWEIMRNERVSRLHYQTDAKYLPKILELSLIF
jgi:hypothetical protein